MKLLNLEQRDRLLRNGNRQRFANRNIDMTPVVRIVLPLSGRSYLLTEMYLDDDIEEAFAYVWGLAEHKRAGIRATYFDLACFTERDMFDPAFCDPFFRAKGPISTYMDEAERRQWFEDTTTPIFDPLIEEAMLLRLGDRIS